MEACDAIYYPMKNKKSNTALKMRKRRRLGAFIFVVVLLALAVVAVRIYNMDKPSRDAELLTLVNPWNTIPDGYEPQLCTLSDGQQIDRRCYDDLMRMLDDCRAAGNSPYICSTYRTWDKQQALFDNKIQRLENEGMDADTARVEAAKVVAVPGTSEHQLGLALDIIDTGYTNLDEGQEDTATQQWLMAHCWDYGFILRYPNGTTDITGIIYEPWHYRYVGRTAAAQIHELGVTFEEYIDMFYK